MPCYDPYTYDVGPHDGSLVPELTSRLNTVTRLLCGLCGDLKKEGYKILNPELKTWLDRHKEADKDRERMEEQLLKRRLQQDIERAQAQLDKLNR